MLKNIDPLLSADLLQILDAMGHGDEVAFVDRNFPAQSIALETMSGQLIIDKGVDSTRMARAIFSVFPLDTFVPEPILRMEKDGAPDEVLAVHGDILAEAQRAESFDVKMGSLERQTFYAAAKAAYAVVQTGETRPYACFLLKKGVITAP